MNKINDVIDCLTGSTYTGESTILNCTISQSKISTDSLDHVLLARLDKMEKMINDLYYPMKGEMK
jgi:hypothetical protein